MQKNNLVALLIFAFCSCYFTVSASDTSAVQRDPTRPAVNTNEAGSEGEQSRLRTANLKLNLIRYSSEGSSAVINGDTYMIGDRLGGWDVQNIEVDRVILIRNNEQIVLSVFSGLTRSSFKDNP
ncbi:hypothetical protein CWE13_06540 [Aliidiomarina shirensis]|uniref:MSHA biogenesis protein MshK n=2 Tax=Aliidiomarina shirensis TaxID=1048642 RepID=A0A432WV29_9GAMM|nr:hypothetical protein CWE13_06540 [Aliidiomarina shirensis]